jgi:hypothetical protein
VTPATARELGARGGRATADRHGSSHMSRIGYSGFLVNLERNFFGDHDLYRQWLRAIARGRTVPSTETDD